MDDVTYLRERIGRLFEDQKLAVLSTHDAGQPYAGLICFLADEKLKYILFGTSRTTRKFYNLMSDGRVALLIDDSKNQISDIHDAAAVTATGRAAEVEENEYELLAHAFLKKHPYLDQFISAPTTALVKVTVDSYYLVEKFQNVKELHIKQ